MDTRPPEPLGSGPWLARKLTRACEGLVNNAIDEYLISWASKAGLFGDPRGVYALLERHKSMPLFFICCSSMQQVNYLAPIAADQFTAAQYFEHGQHTFASRIIFEAAVPARDLEQLLKGALIIAVHHSPSAKPVTCLQVARISADSSFKINFVSRLRGSLCEFELRF